MSDKISDQHSSRPASKQPSLADRAEVVASYVGRWLAVVAGGSVSAALLIAVALLLQDPVSGPTVSELMLLGLIAGVASSFGVIGQYALRERLGE